MDTLDVKQKDMVSRAGWSKTTASLLYNCRQDYTPDLVEQAAQALNLRPFELLMPPDEAIALRKLRESALRIAAEQPTDYKLGPPEVAKYGT